MALCINCGVDLDEGIMICPLCGRYQGNSNEQDNLPPDNPSTVIQIHKKENRRYFWELSGIITFSGIAVCTIVDLLISKGLRWSLFSDASIMAAWLVLTLFIYAYKKTLVIIPGLLITSIAALFVFDLISSGRSWFFPVALPLIISVFLAGGVVIVLYRVAQFRGFNVIALTLIVLAGLCIMTEMILDNYLKGFVNLRWSLIASISVLPVSLILIFYHYRLKKGNRLDSFFHV